MGAPSINIAFYEKAVSAIQRGDRGVVAMILVDESVTKTKFTITSVTDIPGTLSKANQKQIELALIGYQTAPKKILVYVVKPDAGEEIDYTAALSYFESQKWDYLVAPSATTNQKAETIASWIKTQRADRKTFKAVLAGVAADNEGIINVDSTAYQGEDTFLPEALCARIAGLICGTPLTISCTYAPLSEMTDCTRLSRAQLDTSVDAGKFVLVWDGEKVKVCRGVNSFVTTVDGKGDSFKKIKVVDAMDLMSSDIRMTIEDSYIGKYANSYDNKCLLITAINGYFATLSREGILSEGTCQIDLDAQREYFNQKGGTITIDGVETKVDDCTDDEIKRGNTGSKVFLKCNVSILDAIEDVDLEIYI